MLTYAQNFEDVMLARLFVGQETGFYIDVGACEPGAGLRVQMRRCCNKQWVVGK